MSSSDSELDVKQEELDVKLEEFEVELEELEETPEEVLLVVERINSELLPEKSKARYIAQFNLFKQWCGTNLIESYTESALLSYFRELVNNEKKSLWAIFSMLKSCLIVYENVDISKYTKLIAYLKAINKHYKPKRSKSFGDEEIAQFLTTASDHKFLLMKTALIIGVCGACRRSELYSLKVHNVNIKDDIILIEIPDTTANVCASFAITQSSWVEIVKKYMAIRLKLTGTLKNFFMRYEKGRCVNSPVGLNTIGAIPSRIAKFLKLDCPMEYTGHNFRRTSANLLANRGGERLAIKRTLVSLSANPSGNLLAIKNHKDWRSSEVGEGYVEQSLKRKIDDAEMIGDGPSTSKKIYHTVATQTDVVASTVATNTDCPISSIDKDVTTEAPVKHHHHHSIDLHLGDDKIDSEQLIPGLFSKVEHCNITINVYNNCNITK
ncbi:hypothetical protein MTP99_007019 [Tenebrio molitor]|nr:hypothetical protein MTP99_007019 [Tenebrio molitor]